MNYFGVRNLKKIGQLHKAFTLAEALIAIAVIAIIAAIVMPTVITRMQNRNFDLGYNAEVREISTAIEGLTVAENVSTFNDTSMNIDSDNAGDEDAAAELLTDANLNNSARNFLNSYAKLTKYCGFVTGDCFAANYSQYNDRQRVFFDLGAIINNGTQYEGLRYDRVACGLLKNGMSLCISPQVSNTTDGTIVRPIRGFIDLNGRKEPNVLGRDLRFFSIDVAVNAIRGRDTGAVATVDPPQLAGGD